MPGFDMKFHLFFDEKSGNNLIPKINRSGIKFAKKGMGGSL